ncbi:APC family permease [Herbiconiux moechotypicola]|uniref:APC family permease n=1 Tax=Herbiconiux moechotypicola TaxID=637393 RepID=A0ABP5QFT5_9MICO|nr:APC family permease [Herbiconiux moechotypicola]MCS5729922.1 APC family permease [Herbiconiux moechotypicola]
MTNNRVTLTRNLSVGSIVLMVVAAAAPLTCVIGIIPVMLLLSGNVAVPVYFIIAGLILLLFSVGYTRMSRFVDDAGGFFSYIRAGLGSVAGGSASTLAIGAYGLTLIALFAYAGAFAAQLVGSVSGWTDSPWWLWAVLAAAVVAVLGYRNIDLSAKALGILLLAETLLVVVLDVAIIGRGPGEGYSLDSLSPATAATGAPGLGLLFAFLCFLGFEATTVFRAEAKDPERTIPRATLVAVGSIGIFYAATAFLLVSALGPDAVAAATADPTGVITGLAAQYLGPVFGDVLQVLVLTSLLAAAISFHNVVNRYQVSMSAAGLIPAWFGRIHTTHRSPANASIAVSGIVIAVLVVTAALGLDPISQIYAPLSGCLGLAALILMCATSIAVIVYFRVHQRRAPLWATVIAPVIALLGLGAIVVLAFTNLDLLSGSPASSIFLIALLVVLAAIGGGAEALKNRRSRTVVVH